MLSILIPVYNYSIIDLGKELLRQGKELSVPYEILFLDDVSTHIEIKEKNRLFCENNNLSYYLSPHKLGRSNSRNLLASKAQYEWLLFLDSDVFPVNQNFLKTYILSINTGQLVFSGNVMYRRHVNDIMKNILRWKYGSKYEEVSIKKRIKYRYLHVKSANLFIRKDIFFLVKFSNLKYDYGFEDTLFGLHLEKMGIKLELLENAVYHDGIESNQIFLDKTEESIRNLAELIKKEDFLCFKIRLVKIYLLIRKLYLAPKMKYIFEKRQVMMRKNLLSENPNITIFQLYKLCYLCQLLA